MQTRYENGLVLGRFEQNTAFKRAHGHARSYTFSGRLGQTASFENVKTHVHIDYVHKIVHVMKLDFFGTFLNAFEPLEAMLLVASIV